MIPPYHVQSRSSVLPWLPPDHQIHFPYPLSVLRWQPLQWQFSESHSVPYPVPEWRYNNNKLTSGFIETIAGQWKRAKIETASKAMEYAEKEYKKKTKTKEVKVKTVKEPTWFNEEITKKEATEAEKAELEALIKGIR